MDRFEELKKFLTENKEKVLDLITTMFPDVSIDRDPKRRVVAQIGSVFIKKNEPERYYAFQILSGDVGISNLNSWQGNGWTPRLLPEDKQGRHNDLTQNDVEALLHKGLKFEDIVILPKPKELVDLLT